MSKHLPKNNEAEIAALKAEIQKLALKRICVLEKEILEQHNMTVRTGIELEFFGHPPSAYPSEHQIILAHTHSPSTKDTTRWKDNFSKSPFITFVHPENFVGQYEIRLDSQRHNFSYPSFHNASVMARAAIATQKLVQKRTPELYSQIVAKFIATHPYSSHEVIDTHINVSLWDARKISPLFSDSVLLHETQIGTLLVQKALLPLVMESSDSLKRLGRSKNAPYYFGWDEYDANRLLNSSFKKKQKFSLLRRFDEKIITASLTETMKRADPENPDTTPISELVIDPTRTRLENRLAGADADPALAILISVAGLHYGLNHQQEMQNKLIEGWQSEEIIPKTAIPLKTILKHFEQSEIAKEMLGEELHSKIVECRKLQYVTQGKQRG